MPGIESSHFACPCRYGSISNVLIVHQLVKRLKKIASCAPGLIKAALSDISIFQCSCRFFNFLISKWISVVRP